MDFSCTAVKGNQEQTKGHRKNIDVRTLMGNSMCFQSILEMGRYQPENVVKPRGEDGKTVKVRWN